MSRFLIVEDEDPAGEELCRELRELGATVDRSRDGQDALTRLARTRYDGVVLDLRLGSGIGPQGLSVLEKLRSSKPDLPVVVLTGQPHLAVRAFEIGVDALLYKPVQGSHVINYIRRAVELNQLRAENRRLRRGLRLAMSTYGLGILAAVVFAGVLLLWRWLQPDDRLGRAVVLILFLVAIVGSHRISRLGLEMFKMKLNLEMEPQTDSKRLPGEPRENTKRLPGEPRDS